MFVSRKSNLNEWKNWTIDLVGSTMSSIDQATSRWFWNLINDLPRDYFAKTFDQVNYLDKRVWEGMFRARIEEIKEQLELGVSESIVEANLVKLQGLVGKYSLSPVAYENGLEELEDFISSLDSADNYLKVLKEVRNEFKEELKSQPVLLKECIEGEVNLERKEGEYYKSLLDDRSLKNASPERVISESPILDKAAVSKRGNSNSKLRNINKLLFSNPGQALTLFLAAQSAFASAANIQMSNSTGFAIGNDTLSFDNNLSNLSEFEGRINENVSLHSISKSSNFRNSNNVRKEVEVVERDLNGRFTEIRDEFKDLRDTGELVEVLTYVKSQRFKRSANELLSEMETVPENQEEIIIGLENKVKALDKEIEQLKNSSSVFDKGYKDQIASLEGQKIILERSFNDMKRQFNQTLSQRDGEIAGLKVIVENLEKQVKNLKEKIQEDERKYLYVECVKNIKARKFKDAEKKLAQINNNTEISDVVKQVYSGRINNFPLLLEFGKSIKNTTLAFWVYRALEYEMSNTKTAGALETIQLAEVVGALSINQQASGDIKQEAGNLEKKLKHSAKDLAKKTLADAILKRDHEEGRSISNSLFLMDRDLFRVLIGEVISDVYRKIDTKEILNYVKGHSYIEQQMVGCTAVFDVIKSSGNLNDNVLFRLASHIKSILNYDNYHKVNSEARGKFEVLKNSLPNQASTLAFASKICIAREGGTYLSASSGSYNEDRRYIVTIYPNVGDYERTQSELQSSIRWEFQPSEDGYFSIRSIKYNEYLYVTDFKCKTGVMFYDSGCCTRDFGTCYPDRRYVFTWIPKVHAKQDKWEVLNAYDGYVRIKNVYHSGYYLYLGIANSLPLDGYTGVAFAENDTNASIWKLEDCSDKQRKRRDTADELQNASYSEPSSYLSNIALEKTTGKNSSSISR